jgi:hypothetical protein
VLPGHAAIRRGGQMHAACSRLKNATKKKKLIGSTCSFTHNGRASRHAFGFAAANRRHFRNFLRKPAGFRSVEKQNSGACRSELLLTNGSGKSLALRPSHPQCCASALLQRFCQEALKITHFRARKLTHLRPLKRVNQIPVLCFFR